MRISFGKHKGERVEDLPSEYLAWCLENLDEARNGALLQEMRRQLELHSGKGVVRKAGTWTLGEIEIVGNGERDKIAAETRGPFAVHLMQHRILPTSNSEWTLTHIPTGRFIAQGLPSKAAAQGLADDIGGLINWATATASTLSHLPSMPYARLQNAIAQRSER